jgi:hypothetical protein
MLTLLMHVNSRAMAELHAPLSDIFPPLETHWIPGKVSVLGLFFKSIFCLGFCLVA